MKLDATAVRRYLDRAEELRTLAETMRDIECRESLLRSAQGYVRMAEKAGGTARHGN